MQIRTFCWWEWQVWRKLWGSLPIKYRSSLVDMKLSLFLAHQIKCFKFHILFLRYITIKVGIPLIYSWTGKLKNKLLNMSLRSWCKCTLQNLHWLITGLETGEIKDSFRISTLVCEDASDLPVTLPYCTEEWRNAPPISSCHNRSMFEK